jgi:osmoprotectant transport system permease protein
MIEHSPGHSRLPAAPIALGLLLLGLALELDRLEPVFHHLFPQLERPMYRQAPFVELLGQHVALVAASSLLALCLALGLGTWVTRGTGRPYRSLVDTLVSMGQTVPPVAVLALAVPLIGFGSTAALIALVGYGLLPMLKGVTAGLGSVPASTVEAAIGLGLTPRQVLLQVEYPLAAPVVLAGVRASVTINIGTAAIAATVGAQNLGSPIIIGLSGFNTAYVLQGALLTGLLAITVDAAFDWGLARLAPWRPPTT